MMNLFDMYVILGADVNEIWSDNGLTVSYSGGKIIEHGSIPPDLSPFERDYCHISFDLQSDMNRKRTLSQPHDWLYLPEMLRLLIDTEMCPWQSAVEKVFSAFNIPENGFEEMPLDGITPRLYTLWNMLKTELASRLVHDHRISFYREPLGAAVCGSNVILKAIDKSGLSPAAELLFGSKTILCEKEAGAFSACVTLPSEPQLLFYRFRLNLGGILIEEPNEHRITVYSSDFVTSAKFHGCIMYQIFPDRFCRIGKPNAEYHLSMGRKAEIHAEWTEPVKWAPSEDEEHYTPNDYYGGNIAGIIDRLPYLSSLGVSAIYLNPVFEADSNHRYNTADYRKIDPMLGTEADFTRLCREAKKMGISVVLDGVFSHTGSDSVYFDKKRSYGHGAYSDPDSLYRSWYDFSSYPDNYRSWWGFDSLPEVNENDPSWQAYILSQPDGVIPHWIKAGASGFRLDVADELPDEVLECIRFSVKQTDPEAIVIGEVWENAVTKISYDRRRTYALGNALDSVMNYPLRSSLISFALQNTTAFELCDFLLSQKLDYPRPFYYSLMNLLSSHDVPRIRTVLALGSTLDGMSREEAAVLTVTEEQDSLGAKLQTLCAAAVYVLPGFPCIYYGDEMGMNGAADPFNRAPFYPGTHPLYDLYATLGKIRQENSDILAEGEADFEAINDSCLCIRRRNASSELITIINRGEDCEVSLPVNDSSPISRCLLSGKAARIINRRLQFVCMHNSAHIFRTDI